MSAQKKYAVLKGVAGWGDRLQCLLQTIGYARKTGRSMVVDWRDSDWTHDPSEPIEKWFSFSGINTTPLSEFLDSWRGGKGAMRSFPEVWSEVLDSPDYRRWIYKTQYYNAVEHSHLQKITNGSPDHEHEVVVCPGVGARFFAYSDCGAINPEPWLKDRISSFAREQGLKAGGYDVVHLRGGSKSWAGGVVPLKGLDDRIKKAWPTRDSYLADMEARYRARLGGAEALEVVILTDSAQLGRDWVESFSFGRMIPTFNEHLRESGIHKLTRDELAPLGVSKEDLNYETLRDFCVMLNARHVVGDGMSVFSKMGDRCRGAGVRMVDFGF